MRFRSALAIAALALLAPAGSAEPDMPARLSSALTWSMDDPAFGGWSGLEISPDGRDFITISDKGSILTGRIERDDNGRITGVIPGRIHPMHHTDGGQFPRYYNDSEGLAVTPDGRVFVSFEAKHRVVEYADTATRRATTLPDYAPFRRLHLNKSLEALAIGPGGALYTIPEVSGRTSRPFPVYRFKAGRWSTFAHFPRNDDFRISGADIGPDGKFYVLERQFSGIFGFASRVRRFTLTENGLTDGKVLFRSKVGVHDNLEGLAVWRDSSGSIRLTMISDDNFKFFQHTEFVEYVVKD